LPSVASSAIHLPSREARGAAKEPAGRFNDETRPDAQSTAANTLAPERPAGPGAYASVPLSETAKSAIPVAPTVARRTPSGTGNAEPVVESARRLKGTAYTVPPIAYAIWPVVRYRPSLPPSMIVFRVPDLIDWTTICALSQRSAPTRLLF